MSEKKESEQRPPTRPSLKVSIPIEIYLKRKEKLRQTDLLKKQRSMLNKMKEDHKRNEAIVKSKNDDKQNIGDMNEGGQKPAPEGRKVFLPYGPYVPRPQRPKRLRRLPYAGYGPRPQGPPRPEYRDVNNNFPMQPLHVLVSGGNQLAPAEHHVASQNPLNGPRFN